MRRLIFLLACSLGASCGPGTEPTTGGGGAGAGGAGHGAGFTTGGGGNESLGGDGGGPDQCEGIAQGATLKPLNLYIMVDASQSMFGSKWQAAIDGMTAFLNDPTIEDVDVALSFFPRPADATPACDQNAYKTPIVPLAPIADNAATIIDTMTNKVPDGFNSPMYPALGGAILEGIDVVAANPDEVAAVLLVTDGKPDGPGSSCAGVNPSDPAAVAGLAASGANFDPSIKTFVVGLPGVDTTIANQIAAGGGTDKAVIVGTVNTAQNFTDALVKARGQLLACRYDIPPEVDQGLIGLGLVNVTITPGGQPAVEIPRNDNCMGGGWYFDDPENPTSILLCEESCALVKDDVQAKIDIVLGCPTIQ
ncbi:MAG: vWA domain-containing protein [Polyangiaceae bacterium]